MPINDISIKEKATLYSIYYSFQQFSLPSSQGAETNLINSGAVPVPLQASPDVFLGFMGHPVIGNQKSTLGILDSETLL